MDALGVSLTQSIQYGTSQYPKIFAMLFFFGGLLRLKLFQYI